MLKSKWVLFILLLFILIPVASIRRQNINQIRSNFRKNNRKDRATDIIKEKDTLTSKKEKDPPEKDGESDSRRPTAEVLHSLLKEARERTERRRVLKSQKSQSDQTQLVNSPSNRNENENETEQRRQLVQQLKQKSIMPETEQDSFDKNSSEGTINVRKNAVFKVKRRMRALNFLTGTPEDEGHFHEEAES